MSLKSKFSKKVNNKLLLNNCIMNNKRNLIMNPRMYNFKKVVKSNIFNP